MGQTFYEVLGVDPTADVGQLNSAYKRASIYYYQIARGTKAAEEWFRRVVEAYSVLFDPERRQVYDATLQEVKSV
jgi:molecular chaperone DnaJ